MPSPLHARNWRTVFAALILSTALSLEASDTFFENPATGRFLLPPAFARDVLQQCSRLTPKNVSGAWRPSDTDIDELEAALPKYLNTRRKAGRETPPSAQAYHRQYVGFTKGSERFIYGNFYPASAVKGAWRGRESSQAVRVCDGGPAFWGIVFRVSSKTFEDIQFNGLG